MDREAFVRALIAQVPEAHDPQYWFDDDGSPLPYIALADTRTWLEDHALDIRTAPLRASVRPGSEDLFQGFWDFIEIQAASTDRDLRNLLAIELFEGVWWTEDVMEYLGQRTRELLEEARVRLASTNDAIGRRPS